MSTIHVENNAKSQHGGGRYIVTGVTPATPAAINIRLPYHPTRVKFDDWGVSGAYGGGTPPENWPVGELWWTRLADAIGATDWAIKFLYSSGATAAVAQWSVSTVGTIKVVAAADGTGDYIITVAAAAQVAGHTYQITVERGSPSPATTKQGGPASAIPVGEHLVIDDAASHDSGTMAIIADAGGFTEDIEIPLGFMPSEIYFRPSCEYRDNHAESTQYGLPLLNYRSGGDPGDYHCMMELRELDYRDVAGLVEGQSVEEEPNNQDGYPEINQELNAATEMWLNRNIYGGYAGTQLGMYVRNAGELEPGTLNTVVGDESPTLVIPAAAYGGNATQKFCVVVRR